ncbi:hypothetical protein Cwoe_1477 [Conexibacter woesei DSM 14684]|uniref:Uncharacterized protein n=1 Tax=Conexibacter woesei (strain DSM 14684 / CCUG 47730 / CIP 108061 / JCM 11494 / NBRC 100937 / ID131577) TaxID=469383 RepID=D3EZ31_CONWI|nr:hypothetical protein Cwoe_1477 [Conexibacter woesei DSM 14684]
MTDEFRAARCLNALRDGARFGLPAEISSLPNISRD